MPSTDTENKNATQKAADSFWHGRVAKVLLVVVILCVGIGLAIYWMLNKRSTERGKSRKQTVLVEVTPVELRNQTVIVRAMGMVIPARSIQLAARVSGEITDVNDQFIPGGHFQATQRIIQIDPRDYELVVQQRKSDLIKAECDLKVEMGQQAVAIKEYELLESEIIDEDKSLVLREPQLATAKANVAAAKAALDRAKLDLKRTTVVAPFNLMVQSRSVNLGSQVAVGATLASLVGMDKYWVQVSVPVDELKWIHIPGPAGGEGSTVRVYYESAWGAGAYRTGTVERLMAGLEPQGRMARLLVAVKDPHSLQSSESADRKLILDSYVRVEIDGSELSNVVIVPRTTLHDGEFVWVMKVVEDKKTLDIRRVKTVWSDNDNVYVAEGIEPGDLLITSNLGVPVEGMALRTAEPDKQPEQNNEPESRQ